MGVMECNRRKCDNIMCDEYLEEEGYICYECLTELRETNPQSKEDVTEFMMSVKGRNYYVDGEFSLDEMLNKREKV